jgi:hypothetical protein
MLLKSFSGYGLPLSLVVIERASDVWKPGERRHVRGNNHAFITATAAIEHYEAGRSPSLCASASSFLPLSVNSHASPFLRSRRRLTNSSRRTLSELLRSRR